MKGGFLHALLSSHAKRQDGGLDYNAAPPNLSTLGNGSIFETWRPKAHVLPPSRRSPNDIALVANQGNVRMRACIRPSEGPKIRLPNYSGTRTDFIFEDVGDPCAHYNDPATGLFHVSYLYSSDNASGIASAVTDDLVTYRDVNPEVPLFIEPGGKNDPIAVFDGSVIPYGINGSATLLYTSVSYLPIHWTIPYTKGAETQSLAVTSDGGKNFTKVAQGPVIPGAPYGSRSLNVTAFRDPYVFQNALFDRLLGSKNGTWYAAVSGGVHDIGPSQFMYRQYDPDFRDWEYLGQWWKERVNSTWGDGSWAGRWAFNFEVGNLFSLSDEGYGNEEVPSDFFGTLGTEGGDAPVPLQTSPNRDMLWVNGNVSKLDNGSIHFEPTMAGRLDWGREAYAAAGKLVPASSQASRKSGTNVDRFISYVWLTGNDYGQSGFPVNQQGWDSTLLTPRELSKGNITNVVNNDLVSEKASWRVIDSNSSTNTVTLTTLRQLPVREAFKAFVDNATHSYKQPAFTLSGTSSSAANASIMPASKFFVLQTSLQFPSSARGNTSDVRAGLKILSSQYESTSIYYQFWNESMIIDRSNSSAAARTTPGIQTSIEDGKLRLFDIYDQSTSQTNVETLDLTIIVDNAVVEVWANDRFVLSTWAWSWYAASRGIEFWAEGCKDGVKFGETKVYEGLVDAWPERSR